jgi:hypothetical protein
MLTTLVIIFVIAYAAIALEHPLNINKSACADRRQLALNDLRVVSR